jgi:hypothetical protein
MAATTTRSWHGGGRACLLRRNVSLPRQRRLQTRQGHRLLHDRLTPAVVHPFLWLPRGHGALCPRSVLGYRRRRSCHLPSCMFDWRRSWSRYTASASRQSREPWSSSQCCQEGGHTTAFAVVGAMARQVHRPLSTVAAMTGSGPDGRPLSGRWRRRSASS